jgi:hypothetical protein
MRGLLSTTAITLLTTSVLAADQTYNMQGQLVVKPDNSFTMTGTMTPVAQTPPPVVPPAVAITKPASGATVSGASVAVNATCTVPEGSQPCVLVDFSIDGVYKSTRQTPPYDYTFDTTTVANGNHTISANGKTDPTTQANRDITVVVNNQVTPPPDGATVFEWTQTFDNEPVGSRVDYPTQRRLFPTDWGFNSNYVQASDNSTPCEFYSGGGGCVPAPTILFKIVADGKTGNGLEVLMPKDSYGYAQPGAGVPMMVNAYNKKFNTFMVEWDEKWRSGFDLHSMGKMGLLLTYRRANQEIYYGPQNMWYACSPTPCTNQFSPVTLNMGDGGGSGSTVEHQVYLNSKWSLDRWYHFKIENALGPSGYYKLWIDGQLYDSYAPGEVSGMSTGQTIGGGTNSGTDSRNTQNPSEFTEQRLGIQPHFGGQYNDRAFNDSRLVLDNIHARGFNR